MQFRVSFPGTNFPEQILSAGQELSRVLDVKNSPLLFGCRTGICATCICRIEGPQKEASADEIEVLEVFAPDVRDARLACQVRVEGDLKIYAIPEFT